MVKLFSNMKIGGKLALGFAAIELLMVIVGGLAMLELYKVNQSAVDLGTNWLPSIKALAAIEKDLAGIRRFELAAILQTDKKSIDEDSASVAKSEAALTEDRKVYEPMISSDQERHLYEQISAGYDKYEGVKNEVMQAAENNKKDQARDLATVDGRAAYNALITQLEADIDLNNKGGDASVKQASETYSSARFWIIGLLVAAVAVGILLALSISRSMAGSAKSMLKLIEEVAANNLAVPDIEVRSGDEIGQALANLQNQAIVNGQTPADYYAGVIFQIGNDVSQATSEQTSVSLVQQQLQDQRGAISGVSLDEEAVNLIKFQSAYRASANVISTVNTLLTALFNMM